jgi:hypothetical protein
MLALHSCGSADGSVKSGVGEERCTTKHTGLTLACSTNVVEVDR